ncbi:MAG: class I SAM-dependent methyltransferase [bacterium]
MKLLRNLFSKQKQKPEYYWEYYNRLNFVSSRIKELNLSVPRILDVGGATGNNLLLKFGIPNVTTLDTDPHADMVANAENIPAQNNFYDIVTCIDTLEHIPLKNRDRVIYELIRVASKAIFIVAPVDSPENNKAERLVLKYTGNKFIEEHQKYGLVNFKQIESILHKQKEKSIIKDFKKDEIDNLLNWVIMMARGYVNETVIYQECFFLENFFYPRRNALSIYK